MTPSITLSLCVSVHAVAQVSCERTPSSGESFVAKPMANEPGVTTVVSKYALSCSTGISASTLPEPEIVLPCTVTVGALFLDESPMTGSNAGPTSVGSPEEKQQPILRPLRLVRAGARRRRSWSRR